MNTFNHYQKNKYEQLDEIDTKIRTLAELFAEIEQDVMLNKLVREELLGVIRNKITNLHKQYEEILHNDTL